MKDLRLLLNIIRREQSENYEAFYRKMGITTLFSSLCKGTASKKVLDYLGLESTKKVMIHSLVTAGEAEKLLSEMEQTMGLSVPGNGLALTVPIDSIGGKTTLNYLTDGRELQKEEHDMNETSFPYALVIVIAEKGSTDPVMDAARAGGAKGGTVVNAKGTGTSFTQKFFGMSLASEKELIYIVCRQQEIEPIIRSVNEKCGMQTKYHAAAFSMPVETIAGLRSLTSES